MNLSGHKKCFSIVLLCLLTGCAIFTSPTNPNELARTLDHAVVAVPANEHMVSSIPERSALVGYEEIRHLKKQIDQIPIGVKVPLVVYIHGCSGFSARSRLHCQFLFNNGYAVIAPDSFARKYKPMSCDHRKLIGGLHRGVLDFRLAEARHAVNYAMTSHWVDKDNIFLMGHSEGGLTTARYGHGGLAGRVILGWTCNAGWSDYHGLSGPRDEHILSIVSKDDPWFVPPWTDGDCGQFMSHRENSKSVVLDGLYHDVLSLPKIQDLVRKFLNERTTTLKSPQ